MCHNVSKGDQGTFFLAQHFSPRPPNLRTLPHTLSPGLVERKSTNRPVPIIPFSALLQHTTIHFSLYTILYYTILQSTLNTFLCTHVHCKLRSAELYPQWGSLPVSDSNIDIQYFLVSAAVHTGPHNNSILLLFRQALAEAASQACEGKYKVLVYQT